jgi:hypothetical protein|tara:strand:+ start:635 stop:817 length:183 start_codon:yes stop_codon:yes gene_type:complete
MDYQNISSGLISTGIIFTTFGVLKELSSNNYSVCLKTNLNIASFLILSGCAFNMYNLIKD